MPEMNVGAGGDSGRAEAVRRGFLAKIVIDAREKLSLPASLSAKERWTLRALLDEVAANAEATGIAAVWGDAAAIGVWSAFVFRRALMHGDLADQLGSSVAGGAITAPSTLADLFSVAAKVFGEASINSTNLRDATNQTYETSIRFRVVTKRPSVYAIVADMTVDGAQSGTSFRWQRETQLLDDGIPAREAPQLLAALDSMPPATTDMAFEAVIAAKKVEVEKELREQFTPADTEQLQAGIVESGRIGGRRIVQIGIRVIGVAVLAFMVSYAVAPPVRAEVNAGVKRAIKWVRDTWIRWTGRGGEITYRSGVPEGTPRLYRDTSATWFAGFEELIPTRPISSTPSDADQKERLAVMVEAIRVAGGHATSASSRNLMWRGGLRVAVAVQGERTDIRLLALPSERNQFAPITYAFTHGVMPLDNLRGRRTRFNNTVIVAPGPEFDLVWEEKAPLSAAYVSVTMIPTALLGKSQEEIADHCEFAELLLLKEKGRVAAAILPDGWRMAVPLQPK
jgi:hypothetical protein